MDHQEAAKTRAVERYLLGEMPPPEREAFEDHYFSCGACAEEVRIGAVLKAEVPAVLREGVPQRAGFRWSWPWLNAPLAAAVGAALLLAVVVAYQNLAVFPALQAPRTLGAAIYLDGLTRAAGPKVAAGDPLRFQMALDGLTGAPRLSAELENSSGRRIRAGEIPAPAAGQPLDVFFPGSLDPGRYRLVVREVSTGKEIARSGFEVVK
jgi:hypothetical protein